jgi:ATP-dependent DNA helicase 2 subunit 2
MDLTTIPDEEGQPRELLNMKHVVNPTRQYFQQVVMHKAITQSDQIPPISNVILDYLRPEATVLQYAHDELEKVK